MINDKLKVIKYFPYLPLVVLGFVKSERLQRKVITNSFSDDGG